MVRLLTLSLVTFGAVATLTAQAPPAPPTPAAAKVTYTGCLKPGTAPGSWLLENASMGAAAANAADRPAGTSGVASGKNSLGLTAKATDNLKPHANHKIEVTGTLGASAAPGPDAAASAAAATPQQTLAIDSFKMVSATCP